MDERITALAQCYVAARERDAFGGFSDEMMEFVDPLYEGDELDDREWLDALIFTAETIVRSVPEHALEGELFHLGELGFDMLFFRCPASAGWLRERVTASPELQVMREVTLRWKATDEFPLDNWL